jgi:tetratricopeptide (TPR) repeat protein
MLDKIDIEENLTNNQDNYEGLISTIEIGQGMLVLIIAACAPGAFQDELIDRYEAELAPSIPRYRIELDRSEPSLRQALEELVERQPELKESKAPAAITVTGAANLRSVPLGDTETNSALDRFFGYLQWTREGLREFPYPIVLWVTPQILTRLSAKAPDFWSWRGGVFRFIAPVVSNTGFRSMPMSNLSFKKESASDLPIDELVEQVAQISTKNPNSATLATLFDRLGQAYTDRVNGNGVENQTRAIEYFQQALTIQTTLNLEYSKLHTLFRLGSVYFDSGNYGQAESSLQNALTIATKVGDRSGIASSWGVLGDIAHNQGHWDKAESLYQKSLKLWTQLGDQYGMAANLASLGHIISKRGNYDEAESLYHQCLDIAEDLQMTWHIAKVNWNLAQLYRLKSDEENAQQHYSIAHNLYTKLGAKKDLERIESEWSANPLTT